MNAPGGQINMHLHLTLEQLEKDVWPATQFESRLVENCYRYRKIPLAQLSVEQLRLLIGQQIGLPYLVPLALDMLTENILAEGDLYEGDLWVSVARLPKSFWVQAPDLHERFLDLQLSHASELSKLKRYAI